MPINEHPLRNRLNGEFHARPPIPLRGSATITHLACLRTSESEENELTHLGLLATELGASFSRHTPELAVLEVPGLIMRWERHTEFSSYTVFRTPIDDDSPLWYFEPLAGLPQAWITALPGELLVACAIELRSQQQVSAEALIARHAPDGRQMVVARAAEGGAWIVADFLFGAGSSHCDQFSRFVVLNESLTPRQAGRTVQRLIEIETYRLFALLGLPVARALGKWMRDAELTLAGLTDRIVSAEGLEDEHAILESLSALAADVERTHATTAFRFGASKAYCTLVMQRISELREVRVSGFPTFREFMERRLDPPMATCTSMGERLDRLSGRLTRGSALLRTRVEVGLARQNQVALAQMNQRTRLQFHLQETVEGLSVIAITYYGSQLVLHLAEGIATRWPLIDPAITSALSVPAIAAALMWKLHRFRARLQHELRQSG